MRYCTSGDPVNAQTTCAAHLCMSVLTTAFPVTATLVLALSQCCTPAAADPHRCPTLSPRCCVSAAAARGGGKASGHLQGASLKQLVGQASHSSKARHCMAPALLCITPPATGAHEHLACPQQDLASSASGKAPCKQAAVPQAALQTASCELQSRALPGSTVCNQGSQLGTTLPAATG